MTSRINTFTAVPFEVQAAVWDPEDDVQRVAIITWLSTYFQTSKPLHNIDLRWEYEELFEGIYLIRSINGQPLPMVYAKPGDLVVLDMETGGLHTMDPDVFQINFEPTETSVIDDGQPALISLGGIIESMMEARVFAL